MTTMTTPSLSRAESLSLITITAACVAILLNAFQGDDKPLIVSLALSGLAFCASFALIRWLGPTFMKAGFKGVDLSKHNRREIPECMGAVCAAVYLFAIIVFVPFAFYKDVVAATSGGGNKDVVHEVEHVQQGRFLHRFPHSKVGYSSDSKNTADTDRRSSRRTSRPSSPSTPSPRSAWPTTSSISAGATSSSSPPSPRSPC
jgi:UDP-N-acetylglucosamine--dolichyl-phosphate N-acetylglucosaminephosphotransferase